MNEKTLAEEFTLAVHGEPPLGFDPDDAVTKAAQRHRRRRASALVGVGVAAVAVAAVAVPVAFGHGNHTASLRPGPADGSVRWPAPEVSPPHLDNSQEQSVANAIQQHLRAILPKISPGAEIHQVAGAGPGAEMGLQRLGLHGGAVTDELDSPSTVATLSVGVAVPNGSGHPFTLRKVCDDTGYDVSLTITCSYDVQPDGDFLVTMFMDDRMGQPPQTGFTKTWVYDFRTDGVVVTVSAGHGYDGPDTPMLTTDQLSEMATDPGFTVGK